MVKQAVKVLIRARPTASFASKNIKLDPLTGVRLIIVTNMPSRQSQLPRISVKIWVL